MVEKQCAVWACERVFLWIDLRFEKIDFIFFIFFPSKKIPQQQVGRKWPAKLSSPCWNTFIDRSAEHILFWFCPCWALQWYSPPVQVSEAATGPHRPNLQPPGRDIDISPFRCLPEMKGFRCLLWDEGVSPTNTAHLQLPQQCSHCISHPRAAHSHSSKSRAGLSSVAHCLFPFFIIISSSSIFSSRSCTAPGMIINVWTEW